MALFGLSMMIGVSGGSVFKGLLAGALGLLVSTIGMDPMTGALRFTFGNINMLSGIEFVVVMVGMLAWARCSTRSVRAPRRQGGPEERPDREQHRRGLPHCQGRPRPA